MNAMKLSIVVCSYNQSAFIGETLKSLVMQKDVSPEELEIVVIDGGSTDGTMEVVRQYSSRLAYFVSEKDRGQTHALNKGFARTTGNVLGWLCSDDLLEIDAARFVLDYFRSRPEVEFLYGDSRLIGPTGDLLTIKKEIPFSWFLWKYGHNYIPQPSAFWRSSLHKAVNGLDEAFDLGMDADLWARFAERTKPCHVRKVLSSVRWYPQQKTQRLRSASIDDHHRICRRYGVDHDRLQTRALTILAKACRAGWKTAAGCYW